MEKNNSIINSLKRLERFGSEDSKTIEKLKVATNEVANEIIENLSFLLDSDKNTAYKLPEGYCLVKYETIINLIAPCCDIYNSKNILNHKSVSKQSCFKFASDIAAGYLDKINKFLEEIRNENKRMLKFIEKENINED